MSITLCASRWFGFQMLPGYGPSAACRASPLVYVQRLQPLRTGKGVLEIGYFNPLYAEGAQDFDAVQLKILLRQKIIYSHGW